MRVDRDTQVILQAFKEAGGQGIEILSVQDARDVYVQNNTGDLEPDKIHSVKDRQITVRDGNQITVRIYEPRENAHEKSPGILFMHGGGWVIGDLETHDSICRRVAKETQYSVIAVDYRLAPEYPFPYPLHDCIDALLWLGQEGELLQIETTSIIVMGDSAGGNLATILAHQFNKSNDYHIAAEVLFYPVTTAIMDSPSYERFAEGYPLSKKTMEWFINHYVTKETDPANPQISPLYYEDLQSDVATFIMTVGLDPLCDEGVYYAQKLITKGHYVVYQHQPDTMHGILTSAKAIKLGEHYIHKACDFIKEYFK
ncbi:alpha/beta hydrolase [Ignatzschineria rhizosphaerae]|uniref:Alpha/beta hydrolase n=1 Tax=Ignatzschineria rhizosphaerae TaxID=2923279 RepID=A0ABY3X9L4_9GAMM|nr:alpha/beta hydrolase [Ignatzschineria rhizosphaerae]UNM97411.1 alpha/beta hydrolase [Ignatzschineria rhizosphaerae]